MGCSPVSQSTHTRNRTQMSKIEPGVITDGLQKSSQVNSFIELHAASLPWHCKRQAASCAEKAPRHIISEEFCWLHASSSMQQYLFNAYSVTASLKLILFQILFLQHLSVYFFLTLFFFTFSYPLITLFFASLKEWKYV